MPTGFVDGTAIDAVVRGEVVRFESFEEFVQPSAKPGRADIGAASSLQLKYVSVGSRLSSFEIYYSYILDVHPRRSVRPLT